MKPFPLIFAKARRSTAIRMPALVGVQLLLLFLIHCSSSQLPIIHKTVFSGKNITHRKSGLTIRTDERKEIIAVTNTPYHFGLILPYSDRWEFHGDSQTCLIGKSKQTNVSLKIIQTRESPQSYLVWVKKRFFDARDVPGLVRTDTFTYKNVPVMRTEMDARKIPASAFSNALQLNFFTAKKWGSDLYFLHLSRIIRPAEPPVNEEKLLDYATESFQINFNR